MVGMINLWQRFREWLIVRQSKKFAEELKRKNYKPREPWDVGIWKKLKKSENN